MLHGGNSSREPVNVNPEKRREKETKGKRGRSGRRQAATGPEA